MRLAIVFITLFMANILSGQPTHSGYLNVNQEKSEASASYANDDRREVLVQEIRGNVHASAYAAQDTLEIPITHATKTLTKKPLLEVFTSSSCAPSANFNNSQLLPFLSSYEDEVTFIRYPMSWPTPPDPYYTAEGGIRRTYYNVNAVPTVFINGTGVAANHTAILNAFQNAQASAATISLTAAHQIIANTLHIRIRIEPDQTISNLNLLVAVIEKTTHNNATTNGETSFRNVLMKFAPNAEGTPLNIQANQSQSFTFEQSLVNTNIEEMDDLEVVIFVQDSNKSVLQSAYSTTGFNVSVASSPPEGGLVTGSGIYAPGETVQLSAEANAGFSFQKWTLNGEMVSQSATFSAEMPAEDQSYTAHFVSSCEHDWSPLPNLQFNMQIVAQILIDGQVSFNPNDVLGAFVGDECRGIASPDPALNGIVFLTVGSNVASGEQIELKIWNSSDCSDCNAIPGFEFVNQGEIGNFLEAYQVRCGAIQDISFGQGYTWFSLNVNPGSMTPASLFTDLTPCYDDRVIGQTSFALFTGSTWVGSLTNLGMDKMYRMKLCSQQSMSLMGDAAPLSPISLSNGYTWLGYSPQECLPINQALANMTPAPAYDDRLIGQSSFALFTGSQWVGTLTTLCPDAGYVIRLANASTLKWPNNTPAPVAAFTADLTEGEAPLTVNFSDQSSNNPTSWLWDFGDGTTSSTQNPAHTYQTAGSFTVQLTVSNGSGGSDTETKIDYITATENTLWPPGTVHCTGTPTAIVDVTNPITGKTWMDRNLGASQAATSSTDELAYGDLYQWGRFSDGHQCINSATNATLSGSDSPDHGDFINVQSSPFDWRSPQNHNLWQGVNGINNPCPHGYRLPSEAELNAERESWNSNGSEGAFASLLKFSVHGSRFNGVIIDWGQAGSYWSSTIAGSDSWKLSFSSGIDYMSSGVRARGLSVRCIKDTPEPTLYNLNIEVNPANSGSVTGAGNYQSGTAVTITATPNQGWEFVNWTGDVAYLDNPNAATATVTMPEANVSLTANFQEETGLWPPGTVHCSGTPTAIVDVTNPITGKTWMDRNLGASQAATSSTDELAYGDLYQWGRFADGHQCRNSATTTTLSSTDTPGHGEFILISSDPYDWRITQNNDLWQGINGINNPCPIGYRIPNQVEIDSERASWTSNNSTGAITSPIKLPLAGYRDYGGSSIGGLGMHGAYWSSGVDIALLRAYDLYIVSNEAFIGSNNRASGFSVRCIKDSPEPTLYNLNLEVNPSNGGSVTGAGAYLAGTAVTITATPNQGWEFVNWTGDVAYLDNPGSATATVTMPEGNVSLTANFQEESNLWPPGTVHCSGTPTAIVDVTNPVTGKTWMDRNLGASQAATSSTDELAYGDLYQWGRFSDGHQCRNSGTTNTLSSTDVPGHGEFILAPNNPYDWRSPQNNNLWQGVIGINNPCPSGYRLPTDADLNAERLSWSSYNAAGAYASPLKLPVAGYRYNSNGSLDFVGSEGIYWSATVDGTRARYLLFFSSNAYVFSGSRAGGFSVRCLEDTPEPTLYNLNLEVNPANTGSITGAGAYQAGATVTITATPNQGWEFVSWTGDVAYLDNSGSATATVTMPEANVSLTANFQEETGLWPPGTVHCTGTPTAIVDVTNPVTGKTWMDRNLGAAQAATSSTDELAYGDLYQWGRFSDGHQCRNSGTTTTLSSTDMPGHGDFILAPNSPFDWRSPQNNNLWQGLDGYNNPCPYGYRLPTSNELDTERQSWSSNNAEGAYNSVLKLPVSGYRVGGYGHLSPVGETGRYWSANVNSIYYSSLSLVFTNSIADIYSQWRGDGYSVRCLKDTPEPTLYNLNIGVNPTNGGSITGAGAYQSGTAVTITATPNQGWEFVNWTGDVAYLDNPGWATATVTMPEGNVSLVANFQEETGLWPPGTVHCTGTPTAIVDVTNPITGKTWMDRNLGAAQAATSSTDELAYGDLYQWGRFADGHQCRNSATTTTLSSTDTPEHGDFILAPNNPWDWRSPQNDNLWQGVNGNNNPCPSGYRVPTDVELNTELTSWSSYNASGAFNSPLKLPVAGLRNNINGLIHFVASYGFYWSSTVVDVSDARRMLFYSSDANMNRDNRASGISIRCIKDTPEPTLYNLNIEVNPANSGSVTGAGAYQSGTAVNITATPNQGWEFVNWTGDVAYLDNPNAATATVTMPEANVSLIANFVEEPSGFVCGENFTDSRDGQTYTTVLIGNQCWMKENLKYLSEVAGSATGSETEPYHYVYDYNGTDVNAAKATGNYQNYGVLYNWPASLTACPSGWHLPSDTEWTALIESHGGWSFAGEKLKSTRTTPDPHPRWESPNEANNQSDFSALPGGYRGTDGSFGYLGYNGLWWSSTEHLTATAWNRDMHCSISSVYRDSFNKVDGFSVRCLRD